MLWNKKNNLFIWFKDKWVHVEAGKSKNLKNLILLFVEASVRGHDDVSAGNPKSIYVY